MNRGTAYLIAYLGLAWLLAGGGAVAPAWESFSESGEGADAAVEAVKESYKDSLDAAKERLEAVDKDDETAAATTKSIKAEIAKITADRDAEVKRVKKAQSEQGGGILDLAGPLVAVLLGLVLLALGISSSQGSSWDEEPDEKPVRRRKRRPRDPDATPVPGVPPPRPPPA